MSVLWIIMCAFGLAGWATCSNKIEETFSITVVVCCWMYYVLSDIIGSLFATAVSIIALNVAVKQLINNIKGGENRE